MTVLAPHDVAVIAHNAGFTGKPLAIIIAIAHEESGFDTHATNCRGNTPAGSCDRGILQYNNYWGASTSDNCAYDPVCAFATAYSAQYTNGGRNFTAWKTYTSGKYQNYMPQATALANSVTGGSIPTSPVNVLSTPAKSPWPAYTGKPWYDFGVTRPHGGGEHGIDLGTPLNTPMTAVFSGTVTDISGFGSSAYTRSGVSPTGWGGQVTWKLDNPAPAHGAPYEYVIHLNAINPNLKVGSHINSGDLIGWTGGEVPGQPVQAAPTGQYTIDSSRWSGGQHTEVGLSLGPQFGTGAGFQNNPDPTFMIALAQAEHLPYGTGGAGPFSGITAGGVGLLGSGFDFSNVLAYQAPLTNPSAFSYNQLAFNVHNTLVQYQGFYGICLALDEAEQFPGFVHPQLGDKNLLTDPEQIFGDIGQSVVGTIVGNTMPLVIRGGIMLLGYIILFMLFWQLIKPAVGFATEVGAGALGAAIVA